MGEHRGYLLISGTPVTRVTAAMAAATTLAQKRSAFANVLTMERTPPWLDTTELVFRRLMALVEAQESGHWDLASQMESLMTSSRIDLSFIRTQALKQVKLERASRARYGGKSKLKKNKIGKGKGVQPLRHAVSSSESDSGEEQ